MSTLVNLSYPILQFRSRSIVAYNEYVYPRSGSHRSILSAHLSNVRANHKSYSGTITKGSKKRLTKAVSLLVQSTKTREIKNPVTEKWQSFKLSFITLTIPECSKKPVGSFCNRYLLEPFIRVLRRRYGLKNYVWKLELQKNGMVHYHFTSNVFINHVTLKEEWNKILDKNDLLVDYRRRTGNLFPNSTDIKSVRNIKNLEAYLIKYVTKETQNGEKVNSKIWDCSLALKKAEYYSTSSTYDYQERLKSLEDQGSVTSYAGDRYVIFKFKENPIDLVLNNVEKRNYYIHLNDIRNGKIKSTSSTVTDLQPATVGRDRQPSSKTKAALQFQLFGDRFNASVIREGLSRSKEGVYEQSSKALFNSDEFNT